MLLSCGVALLSDERVLGVGGSDLLLDERLDSLIRLGHELLRKHGSGELEAKRAGGDGRRRLEVTSSRLPGSSSRLRPSLLRIELLSHA